MKFKAILSHIMTEGTETKLIFDVQELNLPELEKYKNDCLLNVDIKEYREKRSLSANNYFYVLVNKIAQKLKVSDNEVHNMMLQRYGQLEYIDDKVVYFILKDGIDVNKIEYIHLRPTDKTQEMKNGVLHRIYLVMRGSHTYNSAEMARLIDGTISEAKELGIDVITPDEKSKMLEAWGLKDEVKKD